MINAVKILNFALDDKLPRKKEKKKLEQFSLSVITLFIFYLIKCYPFQRNINVFPYDLIVIWHSGNYIYIYIYIYT